MFELGESPIKIEPHDGRPIDGSKIEDGNISAAPLL
jgi:hypothetical protein